jgi:CubicO group peptidase (beta-lactamase class C family)
MKKILRTVVVLWALLLTPLSAPAQTGTHVTEDHVKAALPALENYMQEAQAKTGVPGVSVAVVFQDQVLYLQGFGVREVGKSEPVTEDTVFQLASLSKPVGSTVIASLVSDGIVSWDTKISDLDPAFQLHEAYPTSQLTVRDLYSHRSGLPGDAGNDLEEIGYERDEILHRLRYLWLASSFRSTFAYSNFGMTAGGVAAVKPTGKSWEEVSKAKLYTPLGMTQTSSLHADFLKETNVAKLHIKVDGKWTATLIRQPDAQAPAGGVSSTAKDMAQWLKLQIANGKFAGTPLMKEVAMLETHAPVIYRGLHPISGNPNFYALGWGTEYDHAGRTVWTHNGAFSAGARTIATIYPQDKLGIVVLSNAFPTGLPEAVAETFFDLVHDGKPRSDHLTPWEHAFAAWLQVAAQAIAAFKTPPSPVQPALANDAYLGTYTNDYLGDVSVTASASGLVLQVGPNKMAFPLKHWNRDVFLSYSTPEVPDWPSPVTFTIGPDGKASQMFIDALKNNGQGVLTRAQ